MDVPGPCQRATGADGGQVAPRGVCGDDQGQAQIEQQAYVDWDHERPPLAVGMYRHAEEGGNDEIGCEHEGCHAGRDGVSDGERGIVPRGEGGEDAPVEQDEEYSAVFDSAGRDVGGGWGKSNPCNDGRSDGFLRHGMKGGRAVLL